MEATIESIGVYIPENKITNQYFEKIIDTNDEWITSRTGIKQDISARKMNIQAICVSRPLKIWKRIIKRTYRYRFHHYSNQHTDQQFPSVASKIQSRFNIPQAGCIDISAGCAGFVYGIIMAQGLIALAVIKDSGNRCRNIIQNL